MGATDAWQWAPAVMPIGLPPPPPPQLCKKRRLTNSTSAILCAGIQFSEDNKKSIIREQEDAFHEYENEILGLQRKLADVTEKHRAQVQQNYHMHMHLSQKNNLVAKGQQEAASLRQNANLLKDQIDTLAMRVFEAENTRDEKETYYKGVILGLQKTSANAEEAATYMRFLHKTLLEYQNGAKVEDMVFKTIKMCSICLSEPANVSAKPCHHLEWCRGCAIDYFQMKEDAFDVVKTEFLNNPKSCPRCKTLVESVDYLYI